jgi:hypothetical protein
MSVLESNLYDTAGARGRKWPVRHVLRDPVPSGRQIIEAAGHGDPTGYIVLQWLLDGAREDLRL